ncbi:hypothetical protein FSP39_009176 [Pinctada imbricata]|uniref:OTU domain-containing protein n=1 Tax=Pinctada imbricata TaxID=66713 RepID=A0AA89C5Q8_PINIB|nr:hypothetical protein FSP39_009176 [Pinctada imbricata]
MSMSNFNSNSDHTSSSNNIRNVPLQSEDASAFELNSAEKRRERPYDVRNFLSSIWRSDVVKVETKTRDEVIKNDIYKNDTDYEIDREDLLGRIDIEQLMQRIHVQSDFSKSKKEQIETRASQHNPGSIGLAPSYKKIPKNKTTSSTKDVQNIIKYSNTQQNISHLESRQLLQNDIKTNIDGVNDNARSNLKDILKKNEQLKVTAESKSELEIDSDIPTRLECDSETPTNSANVGDKEEVKVSEEQRSEEELEFIEMMSTFDRVFPDENDSSTLHELVLKQGLETKTKLLYDAIEEFSTSNGFDMKDSPPNGNCMFHAVNDQLMINGDFRFDEMSLRSKAVGYLKRHPKNKEDIHLECFLINEETWDAYLSRMARSREWGDHLTLKALCEVLGRKIIVHNVQSSESFNTHEFLPEGSDEDGKEHLFLGHLGEFHYISLRPTSWKQTWEIKPLIGGSIKYNYAHFVDSEIIQANEKDKIYLKDKGVLYNDMVLRDPLGFDVISHSDLPLLSVLQSNLISLTDISLLEIPSALYCSDKNSHIEAAGSRSDGTEAFIVHKKLSAHNTEYYRRFDTELPLMIMVADDEPVTCDGNAKCQESQIYVETQNSHAGYCRLCKTSNGRQLYLRGWDVLPKADPNSMKAKRSISGYPCPKWPDCANEWLTRRTSTHWPNDSLKKDISDAGVLVVKKPHPSSSNPETEWMLLFSKAEKKLFDKGLAYRQNYVFFVFKIVVDYFTKALKMRLHTAHLKSIFFFTCEEIHPDLFAQLPGYCFLYLIQKLLNNLNEKYLPNYFIKENNMIDHIPDLDIMHLMDVLEVVRIYPVQCLTFVLEEFGHHRSWIIDIMSTGFGQISREAKNANIFDVVIPTMVRLAQHLARDEMFYNAYVKMMEVKSYLSLVPIRKNGKVLPIPSIDFLLRESFKSLDEFTKNRLAQEVEIHTGIIIFPTELPKKKVKDLTGGENIGGLGDDIVPFDAVGDEYLEARLLNRLGVQFHNKERNYSFALKYYLAAIDHSEKSSENILSELESGGTDDTQARRYQRLSENDSIAFLCFQNISKIYWSIEEEEIIKRRMPVLEKICRRSYGPEANVFMRKLRKRLGYSDEMLDP